MEYITMCLDSTNKL